MSRLIDADAIIEVMKKCAENPENEQALLCYRYAQRILEEAPTVEPVPPWHRVEDGLPDKYTQCLVVDADGKCAVGYYRYDCEAWNSPAFGWIEMENRIYIDDIPIGIGKVVAWMPIELPKEGTHENRD